MQKLTFVYNADGGRWNGYLDMAHKIFSPATYPCSLCDLTYGIFSIRPEWDDFVRQSPVPFEFLHRDEFHAAHPEWRAEALPVVLTWADDHHAEVFLSESELAQFDSVAALKTAIVARVQGFG
jgi:hypothetical protein